MSACMGNSPTLKKYDYDKTPTAPSQPDSDEAAHRKYPVPRRHPPRFDILSKSSALASRMGLSLGLRFDLTSEVASEVWSEVWSEV